MPRIVIDGNHVFAYDTSPSEVYWKGMTEVVEAKFGRDPIGEHAQVEQAFLDCFQFLAKEYTALIGAEKSLTFYLYVFWLHEESIKLHVKILRGFKLTAITQDEFAMYRRILKLTLEQGCDYDLEWGEMPSTEEAARIDAKLTDLIYLGTWLYYFADSIAMQKMVPECHEISFGDDGMLEIGWQYHYGAVHDAFFPLLRDDYSKGTFDENAAVELIDAIEKCFGIDYAFAGSQIFEIKRHHNPTAPTLQTIQPHVLPINLATATGVSAATANTFYEGLTISRLNKLTLEAAILKPYSMQRYFFRPILIFIVGGEPRALVGQEKFTESIVILATNAIHWGALPPEWLQIPCMQEFVNKKGLEHDRVLEDKIEEILIEEEFLFCRNLKSFKRLTGGNFRIDNALAGEIDFIVVNQETMSIFVCDTKYNRARYEIVGFRNDYSNFTKDYEPQLKKKFDWISANIPIVQEHLRIVYNNPDLDLSGFSVKAIFFINTPTFYMFNGTYPAVTLNRIRDFLNGIDEFAAIEIIRKGASEIILHPFFRKPA